MSLTSSRLIFGTVESEESKNDTYKVVHKKAQFLQFTCTCMDG